MHRHNETKSVHRNTMRRELNKREAKSIKESRERRQK